jgi:seryl-tRNA synthetase
MHDLSYFREHLDVFADMAHKRGIALDLDGFRALDRERRALVTETEALRAERNKASDEIGRLKKENQNADTLITKMKALAEPIRDKSLRTVELTNKQQDFLLMVPNLPHASVPVGHSAADNKEVRRWGTPPKFDFQPKPHWEVGEHAGILDL